VVDRDLVLRKLAEVERYLGELAEYRGLDRAAYTSDWKTQRIVERTLHLAIEACMDIADHIVADRWLPVPDTAAATLACSRRLASWSPSLHGRSAAWWDSATSSSMTTRGGILSFF